MRIRISILTLVLSTLAFAAAPALAADSATKKPMSAQQSRMAACSHQSKGMKGDAHKQFMSNCLKGKSAAATTPAAASPAAAAPAMAAAPVAASGGKMSRQDKMKTCSADAKTRGLKGNDRKTFMSACLKG